MEGSKFVFCRVRVCSIGLRVLAELTEKSGSGLEVLEREISKLSCTGSKVKKNVQPLSGTVWEAYRDTVPVI